MKKEKNFDESFNLDLTVVDLLAQKVPENGSIVEIGSNNGLFSRVLASSCPRSVKVYCLEAWRDNSTKEKFLKNTKTCSNIQIIETDLTNILWDESQKVDLVFINGDHTSPEVNTMIDFWSKRVKKGGTLAGHGFDINNWPDMCSAVVDISDKLKFPFGIHQDATIWWITYASENSTNFGWKSNEVIKDWVRETIEFNSNKELWGERTEPWITERAIEFMDNFFQERPKAKVLEFGSGASTLWIAKRTPNLHSVEHEGKFYTKLKKELNRFKDFEVDYIFSDKPYYNICNLFPDEYFDMIIVDGRNRKGCISHSISKLKPGGVIILDNAERSYYHSVFPLMNGWEHVSTSQTKPDKFGFWYEGWKTDWWIKPEK